MPLGRARPRKAIAHYAAAILFLVVALDVSPAAATSPCLPVYQIAYSDSVWTVQLIGLRAAEHPMSQLWYWSPWNSTFESVTAHVGRPPTPGERVTFTDRDGDGNVSYGDTLRIWDDNQSLTNFTIALGASPDSFDTRVPIRLEQGYTEGCGPPPWWYIFILDPIVGFGLVALIVVPLLVVVALLLRRRVPAS